VHFAIMHIHTEIMLPECHIFMRILLKKPCVIKLLSIFASPILDK